MSYSLKDLWHDPVWSVVIGGLILLAIPPLLAYIRSLIKKVSFKTSIKQIISYLKKRINIPIWVGLLFIGVFVLANYLFFSQIASKQTVILIISLIIILNITLFVLIVKWNIKNKMFDDSTYMKNGCKYSTFMPDGPGKEEKISSNFLKNANGVFSIWAYVSDYQNNVQERKCYMYIVGHTGNGRDKTGDSSLARYPNAWAISRIAPTKEKPTGIWRFWCNNTSKDMLHINYSGFIGNGWHLFSIYWSKKKNKIEFYVDSSIVGEDSYRCWPKELSDSLFIGTWPNKSLSHYYNSHIGKWYFKEGNIRESYLINLMKEKPV